jgi:proliferating cell nuclear antigen PCNA
MLQATFKDGSSFKKIIECLKDFVNEISFNFNDQQGCLIQVHDASKVCLISVQFYKKYFSIFSCTRPVSFSVNLANLLKVLNCGTTPGTIMSIKYRNQDDMAKFKFVYNCGDVAVFKIKLMDLECDSYFGQDTQPNLEIFMPSKKFQRICRDYSLLGQNLTISCESEDNLIFSINGETGLGSTHVVNQSCNVGDVGEYNNHPKDVTSFTLKNPSMKMAYSLTFLTKITKLSILSPKVSIGLSKDLPIDVKYFIHLHNDDDDDCVKVCGNVSSHWAEHGDQDKLDCCFGIIDYRQASIIDLLNET